jgi:hypothetical protein
VRLQDLSFSAHFYLFAFFLTSAITSSWEGMQAPKMTDVLLFRRALDFVNSQYPFSPSFGKVRTREECIESAQKVFDRLRTSRRHVIDFSELKKIATTENGVDQEKLCELVRIFRPNRLGEISKLDFIKSCDK